MIASSRAKPSSWRSPLRRIARSTGSRPAAISSGVNSSCSSSGTTFSPITRFAQDHRAHPHQPAIDRRFPGGDAIGRNRRDLRQRELERDGAGLRQRGARAAERQHASRRPRPRCAGAPASPRSLRARAARHAAASAAPARTGRPWPPPARSRPRRSRRSAGFRRCGSPASPARSADRRAGASPPALVRAKLCDPRRSADAPHSCSGGPPSFRVHAAGLERQEREDVVDVGAASSGRGPPARPRPRARRSPRSG